MTEPARPTYRQLPTIGDSTVRHSWDVFGPSDERGTLGFIGPEQVRRAVGTVTEGRSLGLQLPIDLPDPPLLGRAAMTRQTFDKAAGTVLDEWWDGYFPQSGSQWDALAHYSHPDGLWYGGLRRDEVEQEQHLGIDQLATTGLVGRGLLLDVAATAGAGFDPTTTTITPELLDRAAAHHGVALDQGDILCVRTGWLEHYLGLDQRQRADVAEDSRQYRMASAGLGPAAEIAQFCWDHGIAAIALDNPAVEPSPMPRTDDGRLDGEQLCHVHLIVGLGMHLGELLDFEALARELDTLGRHEFLFTAAPLLVPGGTGSPSNALAVL